VADTNDDGFLSFAEFSAIPPVVELAKVKPDEPLRIFNLLDVNDDNKLAPREFLHFPPPPPGPGPGGA
jgi:hypothetical protein